MIIYYYTVGNEKLVVKCTKYWPNLGHTLEQNNLSIVCTEENPHNELNDLLVRKFKVFVQLIFICIVL